MGHINTRFLHIYHHHHKHQHRQAAEAIGSTETHLTPSENLQIQELHKRISKGKNSFNFQQFKDYMETVFPESHIIQRIYQILVAISNRVDVSVNSQTALWTSVTGIFTSPVNIKGIVPKEEGITIDGFSSWIRCFLKGDFAASSHLLVALSCKGLGDTAVSGQNLIKMFELFINYYFKYISKNKEYLEWEKNLPKENEVAKLAYLFLREFHKTVKKTCPSPKGKEDNTPLHKQMFTAADMESWLPQSPLLVHIYHFVASTCFPVQNVDAVEEEVEYLLSLIPNINTKGKLVQSELLSFSSLLMINSFVPHKLQMSTWNTLFSSCVDGFSFQRLIHLVENRGPSVIIIKDTDKHIFGGFAPQKWSTSANFIGNEDSFLFTLAPEFNIYVPTGHNKNFMYFNYGVRTVPCGMGMGGQLEHFSWFINEDFSNGHSRGPCLTFNSPQLSGKREFKIDKIEIWKIHDAQLEKEEQARGQIHQSALDRDLAAKAILSLLDRGPNSEGMREGDSSAEIPDHPQINF